MMARLILWICILCYACSDNCEEVSLGEISYMQESLDYLLFEDDENVLFISQNSTDSLLFVVEERIEEATVCINFVCGGSIDPFQNINCEFLSYNSQRYILRSDDILIDILLSIQNLEEGTRNLYDLLSVRMNGEGGLASAYWPTSLHSNTIDPQKIPESPLFEAAENLTIHGVSYQDVLISPSGPNQLLYAKGQGLLGLKFADSWYLR